MTESAADRPALYSIGHSNHAIERFLALLDRHAIKMLADVRSMPASRHHPQFGKRRLMDCLAARGVGYAFLGRELGGRPRDPDCFVDGVVAYDRVAATTAFRDGLSQLIALARAQRVAMMCAERDPAACHRTHLIAPKLVARGWKVRHILADGSLQRYEGMAPLQPDLFAPV